MRGIHPGQIWRQNATGAFWRVAEIVGDRVVLVEYHATSTKTVHIRNLHGRSQWTRGYTQMNDQAVRLILRERARSA